MLFVTVLSTPFRLSNIVKSCIIYRCDRCQGTKPTNLTFPESQRIYLNFFLLQKALLLVLSILPFIVFSYPVLGPILFLFLWIVSTGIMEWRTVTYWGPTTPKTAVIFCIFSLFHLLSLLPIVTYSNKWVFFLLKVFMEKLVFATSKVWASKKQSKSSREAPPMLATVRILSSCKNGLLSNTMVKNRVSHAAQRGFPPSPPHY